ncbi:hypothetical protein [Salmonella phage SSBI34]|nr:hypothetical protein [Salmonella phage SSBI34]
MTTRMYCVVNQYIAGIHAGIQSAHAIVELMDKYTSAVNQGHAAVRLAKQWASVDKTIIVLNGGYQQKIFDLIDIFDKNKHLPSSFFQETEDALNGALTAACIVLPEYMYTARLDDEGKAPLTYITEDGDTRYFTEGERELLETIKKLRLKGE